MLLAIAAGLGSISVGAAALGAGLTLCFLIYALGNKSGAHLNPAVTYGFTLRGSFPVPWAPLYWIAQFAGAIAGAAIVRSIYDSTAALGCVSVNPSYSDDKAFHMEMWLSCVLVGVILTMASRGGNIGPLAAMAVGFAFVVLEMIGWDYSGGSLNPWRAFGPALVNGLLDHSIWPYLTAPFVGATMAVVVTRLFTGPLKPNDYVSIMGLGGDEEDEDVADKVVRRLQQLLSVGRSESR